MKNLNINDSNKKKELTSLEFSASLLVLIGGLIFLYCVFNDTNVETEIGFN